MLGGDSGAVVGWKGEADADILAQTWSLQLPLRVQVAADSIISPDPLPPFYVLASRHSYTSSISSQLWHLVQHVLPKLPGNSAAKPWLDFEGTPLKTALPLGVLFDLLVAKPESPCNHHTQHASAASSSSSLPLPWHLTLHYTHAPPDTCASWLSTLPHNTQFLNSLKEACHICKGTEGSAAVMRMDGSAQDAMWAAVERGDVAAYRTVLSSLKVIPSPKAQGAVPPHIPVRVLVRRPARKHSHGSSGGGGHGHSVWEGVVSTSRPVPALTSGGEWVTLWQALHALLPALVPEPPQASGHAALAQLLPPHTPTQAAATGDGDQSTPPATAAEQQAATGTEAGLESQQQQGIVDQDGDRQAHDSNEEHASQEGQGKRREGGDTSSDQQETTARPGGESAAQESLAAVASRLVGEVQGGVPSQTGDGPQGRETGVAAGAVDRSTLQPSSTQAASSGGAADGAEGKVKSATSSDPSPAIALPLHGYANAEVQVGTTAGETRPQQTPEVACTWLVCGVQPPLDTPLAWLHAHMHAPDYFLYVAVHAPALPPEAG